MNAILSSLAAWFAAGVRPRTALARAIVLILVIKLIGLVGIKTFMFPESAQPVVSADAMARRIGVAQPDEMKQMDLGDAAS